MIEEQKADDIRNALEEIAKKMPKECKILFFENIIFSSVLTLISMGSSIPSMVWGGANLAPPSISLSRPCRNLKFGGYL